MEQTQFHYRGYWIEWSEEGWTAIIANDPTYDNPVFGSQVEAETFIDEWLEDLED